MATYWITAHDPHDADDRWFLYLKEEGKDKGERLGNGDRVLFYETGNRNATGQKGRKRLCYDAKVVDRLEPRRPPKEPWAYQVRR
ncbi:MAG: hypothetical protein ACR2NO_08835 [Chloroflexota bacterium]